MERKYIFYHTGYGFAMAAITFPLIIIAGFALLLYLQESRLIQISVLLLLMIIGVWLPFKTDKRYYKKKKNSQRELSE